MRAETETANHLHSSAPPLQNEYRIEPVAVLLMMIMTTLKGLGTIVSLLFMNRNGWREAAFIVYFSHDIDTWFVLSRYSVLQLESE